MKKKLKKRKKSVKFFSKKTLRAMKKNTSLKFFGMKKDAIGAHVPMSYKFKYTTTPRPVKATISRYSDYFSFGEMFGKIDSSAARQALADLVKDGALGKNDGSNRDYIIQNLLLEEIKRQGQEIVRLKFAAIKYLDVLERERKQNADLHTKQA